MTARVFDNSIEESLALPTGRASFAFIDKINAMILALAPLLQHYIGLYENMGFTVLLVVEGLLLLKLLANHGRIHIRTEILPLCLFEVYSLLARSMSFSRLLYVGFFVILFFLISDGYVNLRLFYRYAVYICSLASFLVYIQYIGFYVFGYRLQFRALGLLVDQNSIWIHNANSVTSESLFRVSAFFLEPSHMFLYMFPVIFVLLLSPGINKKRLRLAVFLTSGLLLTLSGFGIVASAMVWGVYFMFTNWRNEDHPGYVNRKFLFKMIFVPLILIAVVLVAYFTIPVFAKGVNRMLDMSAFNGRIRLARNYVKKITGINILIGKAGVTSDLEFNLSGFFATYIKWGVIGIVLTYWYYLQGLFKLKNAYFWLTVVIVAISFFTAHTHGTFYMLYYVMFLSMGYGRNRMCGKSLHVKSFDISKKEPVLGE